MSLLKPGYSAPNRRRRPARLGFEDLEGRLVLAAPAPLSPATAILRVAAVPTQLTVPTTGPSIVIDNVVRDAQSGALTFSGRITDTIQGTDVSLPFNGLITPARNARGLPTLTLVVPPTIRSLQGLNVGTTGATLTITPRRGPAGASLVAGLNDVIGRAGTVSPDSAASVLQTLLRSPTASVALGRVIGASRVALRSFSAETTTNPATLTLALRPVNLNTPSLNVRLNNGRNGPIIVVLSGTSGGGLLGNGLVGIVGAGGRRAVLAGVQTALAVLLA